MIGYVIRRLALAIPTMLVVLMISFFLSEAVPSDRVVNLMHLRGVISETGLASDDYQDAYQEIAQEYHYDLPSFYFSVVPHYYPQDIHSQYRRYDIPLLKDLLHYTHSNDQSTALLAHIRSLDLTEYRQLAHALKKRDIAAVMQHLPDQSFASISQSRSLFWPRLEWHGFDSRFHIWISQIISGDWGISILDGRPVWTKVKRALSWTLALVLFSIVFSVILAIPLGVWSAQFDHRWIGSVIRIVSYVLYSIPVFWFATMMLVFFTTNEYGSWTNIFPSTALIPIGATSPWQSLHLLILPIICLSIHRWSYLVRQLSTSIREQMSQLYFYTTLSTGESYGQSVWRHALPNALIPIVTIITGMIPASIAGSVVIEVIFNIPGMGRLLFQSIFSEDWNVLFGVLVIVSAFTILFYLIGDWLYALLNPQIQYD